MSVAFFFLSVSHSVATKCNAEWCVPSAGTDASLHYLYALKALNNLEQ